MSSGVEFAPLRPRHVGAEPALASADEQLDAAQTAPQAPTEDVAALSMVDDAALSMVDDAALSIVVEQPALDSPIPPVSDAREPASAYTEDQLIAVIREEAIRFASIATARALRVAFLDPAAITSYVDDALRACGRILQPVVHLHPDDARAYRPQRNVEIVADAACERGEIAVATAAGSIGATIDERAELLVRAASCA